MAKRPYELDDDDYEPPRRHEVRNTGMFGSAFAGSSGCIFGIAITVGGFVLVAILLCAGVIGGCGMFTKKVVDNIDKKRVDEEKKAEDSAVLPGDWSTVGDCRIGIFEVKVGKPIVIGGLRAKESEWNEPLLQIFFKVENLSQTKKLEYMPPRRRPFGDEEVKLVDEHGNKYRYRSFEGDPHLKDGIRFIHTLNPGDKPIEDLVCFQVPVNAAKTLRLSMSSPISGEIKKHEFRIPDTAWKR